MLLKRILVALGLLPFFLYAIYAGGWFYALVVVVLGGLSAWEYSQLMRASGLQPATFLTVLGAVLLLLQRNINGFDSSHVLLSFLVLISAGYHLFAFERGRKQAVTDFSATLMGILYIGWIYAYLISLRNLPEGRWWTLIVLVSVWVADSFAYVVGVRWGRHPLTARLSPKKTWEGFWGGAVGGFLCSTALAVIFSFLGADIPLWGGVGLGLIVGTISALGDLTISLFKRQAGAKDSGNLIPGHGGVMDRIDSWIWMGVCSYYLITWLWVGS